MWGNWVTHFLDAAKRPITDLRYPISDEQWSIMAFLCHFALGFFLGLFVALLVVWISRLRGVKKVSKWDFRRLKRSQENSSVFGRARDWIERLLLGQRHEALLWPTFAFTLLVAFFSGVIANLIDVDHAPMFYGGPDRVFHKFFCGVAIIVVLYCGTRIVRAKDGYTVRRQTFWFCQALSVIVHVVEDYTIGWF